MVVGDGFNPFLLDQLDLDENQKNNFPTKYNLITPYPNPFNPTTVIRYDIPKISDANLSVFDFVLAPSIIANTFLNFEFAADYCH